MTQLKQFVMWQLRDIGRTFKEITIGGFFAVLIGAQLGHLMFDLISGSTDCIVLTTLPASVLLMFICFAIDVQWTRFKRDQEKVINGLKK